MPGKTATLPDVDKTLKNARVELKTSPDAKNKLREAAQSRWGRFKRFYFERCYGNAPKVCLITNVAVSFRIKAGN
ncbi:ybl13 [Escherichia coli]|uniref:Ybl13 n=1 Tax=Escherichia coli TaxID=562 RepID=A0A2X3M522_ECOLX|nr:ybl13 [Escherichia coli]